MGVCDVGSVGEPWATWAGLWEVGRWRWLVGVAGLAAWRALEKVKFRLEETSA